MKNVLFYTGLALLFTHELDAMPNHEWRVLPVLNSLSDSVGEQTFVLLHIPLFAVVIGLIASLNRRVRARARIVVGGFLVVHGVLHFLFSGHPAYEFSSTMSFALILGAAACGLAYLVAAFLARPRKTQV